MKNKFYLVVFSIFLLIFSHNVSAQIITAEKTGLITNNNGDENLNRQRIIRPKTTFSFSTAQIQSFEKEVFRLINKKRAEKGLPELSWSPEIADMARLHSESMAKNNFFSHSGLDGKQVDGRADIAGIKKWSAIGENIAYNRGYEKPMEIAVEKWLLSPSHRENLLSSNWRETGVGIAVTENGTFYFTQVFLKRR
jgi:uncharacterized protein YkwD